MKKLITLLAILAISFSSISQKNVQHQVTQLVFETSILDEKSPENPFLDYRLNVKFTQGDQEMLVPGFFAADGNAAETSSTSGTKWIVNFTPPTSGDWDYEVSFRKGKKIAVSDDAYEGIPVAGIDGEKGTLKVPTEVHCF